MSKETDSSDMKNPTWQDTEIEEGMSAFSPQITQPTTFLLIISDNSKTLKGRSFVSGS